MFFMRLFHRNNGVWYMEIKRGKWKSLKTRDETIAKAVYAELEEEWLKNRLKHLDAGKNITLAQFTKEYLKHRDGLSLKTIKQDALSLRLLADVLGSDIKLRAIKPKEIDQFKSACIARGVKAKSVNSYLRHIKSALSTAEEWEIIRKRPKIKMLPAGKNIPEYYKPDEIRRLLHAARVRKHEMYRMMVFYVWTGARRREALNLQWQDCTIDPDGQSYAKLKGKGKKERIIRLLPAVVDMLLPDKQDIGPVFAQVHPDTITHWFRDVARSIGIRGNLHMLRHTCATFLLNSGVNVRLIQEILGHAQLATTMIYAHAIKDRLYDEMGKLKFE